MNNGSRPDEIRRRMAEARAALAHDAKAAVSDARTLVDWREHFRAHPWLFCGGAAALGFLLIPRRDHAGGAAPLTPLADAAGPVPEPTPPKGLMAAAFGLAATFAARQAAQYASQFALRWLETRRREHESSASSEYSERGPLP
jgi:hypothetical protein